MPITVYPIPTVLETYFIDEARTMPTAHWAAASHSVAHLGGKIKQILGKGITAGWALTVSCPQGDSLASYVALQQILEHAAQGRWVVVVVPEEGEGESEAAIWSYMHCAIGWEVGVVGAVVAGYVRDIDETIDKLGKAFGVFGYGASPAATTMTPSGTIGAPVEINGVTIRTGDLIVGDSDGVVCVPKDEIEAVSNVCRDEIVTACNRLQEAREGKGAVDVMELGTLLDGEVQMEE